ncbi:DUF6941 family protein [Lysinibacillus capsici]|uniref:DUF6941 family protein n=1 Tax=Lysinibacillus capsici TaxID=2115968 RepID=UPI003081D37B|nr:hypothetical protein ICJ70_07625 [Lysinibacillus capsici]
MNSQLLCCDNIEFNKQESYHVLGRVINRLDISTMPKVIEFYVLIKLFDIEPNKTYEVELQLKDSEERLFSYTEKIILYNRRMPEQVQGVDFSTPMKAVITKCGNYNVELFIDGKIATSYPIYVCN